MCSIAATRRRRYAWAAWWSGAPTRHPFRNPDAHGGGARSEEEALRAAEQATGRAFLRIEARWARAWSRVMQGEPAFPATVSATVETSFSTAPAEAPRRVAPAPAPSMWTVLGVTRTATLVEIKRAYRKRALEAHPDHGGDPESFRALQIAYERAIARRRRPPRR